MSIPSVIKKGRGPDTHHVYQVFVQIDNDEWNIYRRFAEFWEFHNQLLKHVPEVSEFNFPPRRAIGNKVHCNYYCFTSPLCVCILACIHYKQVMH